MPEHDDDKKKQTLNADGTPVDNSPLTLKNRHDWNDYVQWLKDQKLHGHPDLNKGEGDDNNGNKVLQAYIKSHPDTSLSVSLVPHIQKDFANVKHFLLGEVKAGRAKFTEGANEKNFMANISDVDGLAGTKTTNLPFPDGYLKNMDANGKVTSTDSLGLKTANVMSLGQ